MREILFRAKQTNSNNWRYGDLMQSKVYNKYFYRIFEDDGEYRSNYAVNGDTVGQYTGIDDKNGVKVFEGDIVRGKLSGMESTSKYDKFVGYVGFENGTFLIYDNNDLYRSMWREYEFEVIGNKFDNPELLEG